jgi:hypothetical protein
VCKAAKELSRTAEPLRKRRRTRKFQAQIKLSGIQKAVAVLSTFPHSSV